VTPARNWIKQHATEAGHARHWQLDDNIYFAQRLYRGHRYHCRFAVALAVCEDFTDRYDNIGVSGLNYAMFAVPANTYAPYYLNVHVYSCTLILNALPYLWRPQYNEDTDYCLQVLAGGLCTVLINAFVVKKVQTMTVRGGNMPIYQGDGRLRMARSLERDWPGVVRVERRFQRPQHVIANGWQKFDTPLRKRADLQLPAGPDEYGLVLQAHAAGSHGPEVRGPFVTGEPDQHVRTARPAPIAAQQQRHLQPAARKRKGKA